MPIDMRRAVRRLNRQHRKTWAGFYDAGGRYLAARVRAGRFEVRAVATGEWIEVDLATTVFRDHTGRAIVL